jgi:hypothetical protein
MLMEKRRRARARDHSRGHASLPGRRARIDDIDGLPNHEDGGIDSNNGDNVDGGTAVDNDIAGGSDEIDNGDNDDGEAATTSDHCVDLSNQMGSAARIRLWCATMAPGEVLTFCWRGAGSGTGRIECRAAFGQAASSGKNIRVNALEGLAIAVALLAVFVCFRILFSRRGRA